MKPLTLNTIALTLSASIAIGAVIMFFAMLRDFRRDYEED